VRLRALASMLAVAALVAAGVTFSGAAFTAASANPGNNFSTAAVFSSVTLTDPGTPLRGTVPLDASTTGTIVSVTIQRSPAGAGAWTNICTDNSSPYSCSFDTTVPADGLYDLRATADTGSGTVTSAVVANRRIDNTAPSVAMTDPGTTVSGSVNVGAMATDVGGSGVSSVTIQRSPAGAGTWTDICTDNSSPYSCSFDTTTVGDALYDFRAVGTDVAGNSANSTVTNRRIDNVVPTVSLTDPGANIRGTISLDATASDGGGILDVKIQRSLAGLNVWIDICTDSSSPYSCSTDTSTWGGDGLYDLRAIATDNGSRTATSTVTNRRVDNTLPTVTTTDPGANLRGTITLNATASDAGSGVSSVTIQRSPAGAGTWTDVCTDLSSPYSCTGVDTTTWGGDGLYDLRTAAIDVAGNPNTSATIANRRIDNTAPTAGLTDPGSPLRQTVTLNATSTDTGGSGVLNVIIERSPAGAGTWTNICTDATSPYSCSWNTTGVTDGSYDVRATATDNAGNSTTSTVTGRIVDNTAPTATDIQSANAGATVGRPETNDTITFTYSEQIAPASILAGWNGSSTAVTVRITNSGSSDTLEVWNSGNTAVLPLTGSAVALSGNYVTASAVFTATMAQSGAAITVTLGTLSSGTVATAGGAGGTMSWTPSATATDVAGNACTTTVATESGAADKEF
jgi:chitinase